MAIASSRGAGVHGLILGIALARQRGLGSADMLRVALPSALLRFPMGLLLTMLLAQRQPQPQPQNPPPERVGAEQERGGAGKDRKVI